MKEKILFYCRSAIRYECNTIPARVNLWFVAKLPVRFTPVVATDSEVFINQ